MDNRNRSRYNHLANAKEGERGLLKRWDYVGVRKRWRDSTALGMMIEGVGNVMIKTIITMMMITVIITLVIIMIM